MGLFAYQCAAVCVCVFVCFSEKNMTCFCISKSVYSMPFPGGRSHWRLRNKTYRGQTNRTNISLTSTW